MFYIYSIVIPFLILIIGYFIENRPRKMKNIIDLLFKVIFVEFAYAFLIYFLEMENHIDSGWSFYSIIFFLIPISIIVLILKIFYFFKKEK